MKRLNFDAPVMHSSMSDTKSAIHIDGFWWTRGELNPFRTILATPRISPELRYRRMFQAVSGSSHASPKRLRFTSSDAPLMHQWGGMPCNVCGRPTDLDGRCWVCEGPQVA